MAFGLYQRYNRCGIDEIVRPLLVAAVTNRCACSPNEVRYVAPPHELFLGVWKELCGSRGTESKRLTWTTTDQLQNRVVQNVDATFSIRPSWLLRQPL